DDHLSGLIDKAPFAAGDTLAAVAPFAADHHGCQAFGVWIGQVVLRRDYGLTGLVNVAPFPTGRYGCQPFGESIRFGELWRDDHLSGLFDVAPFSPARGGRQAFLK